MFPPLQSSGRVWEEWMYILLWMFGGVPQWSCPALDFCLQWVVLFSQGVFKITDPISPPVMGLFNFLIQLCRLYISRTVSISRLSSLWGYLHSLYSLTASLHFCRIAELQDCISPLSFLTLFIWVLSLEKHNTTLNEKSVLSFSLRVIASINQLTCVRLTTFLPSSLLSGAVCSPFPSRGGLRVTFDLYHPHSCAPGGLVFMPPSL